MLHSTKMTLSIGKEVDCKMYKTVNVEIEITNEVYETIVVDSLKESYALLKKDYNHHLQDDKYSSEWPRVAVFSSDPEKDKLELRNHLFAIETVLSYYMTRKEFEEWHENSLTKIDEVVMQ